MAKRKESVVFVPATKVLTAEVSVTRKVLQGEVNKGSLSGTLDLKNKQLEIDVSMYRKVSIEHWRILAKALIALAKEAEDALNTL